MLHCIFQFEFVQLQLCLLDIDQFHQSSFCFQWYLHSIDTYGKWTCHLFISSGVKYWISLKAKFSIVEVLFWPLSNFITFLLHKQDNNFYWWYLQEKYHLQKVWYHLEYVSRLHVKLLIWRNTLNAHMFSYT